MTEKDLHLPLTKTTIDKYLWQSTKQETPVP